MRKNLGVRCSKNQTLPPFAQAAKEADKTHRRLMAVCTHTYSTFETNGRHLKRVFTLRIAYNKPKTRHYEYYEQGTRCHRSAPATSLVWGREHFPPLALGAGYKTTNPSPLARLECDAAAAAAADCCCHCKRARNDKYSYEYQEHPTCPIM